MPKVTAGLTADARTMRVIKNQTLKDLLEKKSFQTHICEMRRLLILASEGSPAVGVQPA
jgi:hypothetical protein